MGQAVQQRFGSKLFTGKIVGWYPPSGDDVALWHVRHEDGDENDLEGWEVEEALARSRRRSERDRPEVARLVEDAAFLNHAGQGKEAAIKYHLCPRNDWRAFPKKLGSHCARNELGWTGGLPLPTPPNPQCWLLPVEDCAALGIARHRDALRATGWKVLSSSLETVTSLSNKASLRTRAEELGLLRLLPVHYAAPETASYPCILKLALGAYGAGTHIVRSAAEVTRYADVAPLEMLGKTWVLQELVLGRQEIATSMLVRRGVVLDAICTSYEYGCDEYVWPHVKEVSKVSSREIPPEHLEQMARFLRGYDGILNFNYKVRPGGEICVFEINTRLGADLGCDVPTPMLREFFRKVDALDLSEDADAPEGGAEEGASTMPPPAQTQPVPARSQAPSQARARARAAPRASGRSGASGATPPASAATPPASYSPDSSDDDDDDDVPLDQRPTKVPGRTCSPSPAAAMPSEEV